MKKHQLDTAKKMGSIKTQRRSMVLVDDFLYGKCQRHPSKYRSNFELDFISVGENTDRADRTLDALSLGE